MSIEILSPVLNNIGRRPIIGTTTIGTGGDWSSQLLSRGTNKLLVSPTFGNCELQKMQHCGLCSICCDESGSQTLIAYILSSPKPPGRLVWDTPSGSLLPSMPSAYRSRRLWRRTSGPLVPRSPNLWTVVASKQIFANACNKVKTERYSRLLETVQFDKTYVAFNFWSVATVSFFYCHYSTQNILCFFTSRVYYVIFKILQVTFWKLHIFLLYLDFRPWGWVTPQEYNDDLQHKKTRVGAYLGHTKFNIKKLHMLRSKSRIFILHVTDYTT